MKLAVIFGGMSNEHQVSIVSATSIIEHLDKEKYQIYPIYISKEGIFYEYLEDVHNIKTLDINAKLTKLKQIANIITYLEEMDVVFPVLHGKYGEDGTLQGMLELLHKKYVGCRPLASSLCMDKEYTKIILKSLNIPVSPGGVLKKELDHYLFINDDNTEVSLKKEEILSYLVTKFKFPFFIKACNSGSSVGVNKVSKESEFLDMLEDSLKYDAKVLIEKEIKGREVECAILGNDDLIVSPLGEVKAEQKFYSFDAKYKNDTPNTQIPASLDADLVKKVQDIAVKAYKGLGCTGLSRVDFFITEENTNIILNEVNTMPGFTTISMYPKLMECLGISYSELLDKLIALAK